jgi:hypothetical protein
MEHELGMMRTALVVMAASAVLLSIVTPCTAGPELGTSTLSTCPVPEQPVLPAAPEQEPVYPRAMWLRDAARMADVVVRGEVLVAPAPVLRVAEVLCRASWSERDDRQELPLVPVRLAPGERGIFLLTRAPRGYLLLNPDGGPVMTDEWRALGAGQPRVSSPEVELHESAHQLYRSYRRGGDAVWHGAATSNTGGLWMVSLHERGALVAQLGFEQDRLERVSHVPARGRGFFVQYRQASLWRFEHYLDGKKEGLARVYDPSTGHIAEETRFRAGVRHGVARRFDARGRASHQARYDAGLVLPVVRPTRAGGPVPGTSLTPLDDGRVYYAAPRELMARIRPGLTARQVANLLGLPVSPAMGVVFPAFRCDEALHVEFRGQRVARVYNLPNGAHCW